MEKGLQDRSDAIDKVSDVEARIMLKETYTIMHQLSASWEKSKVKLENKYERLSERYESLQKDFADYKNKLRSMFEL
jgi:predicted  nucleic acid-binding Zn-ribbon protein